MNPITLRRRDAMLERNDWEAPMTAPDDMGLDGKVAIVTGGGAAGDGIGNGRAAAAPGA